jgi:DNA polymerase I-like protein with 3'-5' exonuclease and polymerase domains
VFKADGFRGLKSLNDGTLINKLRICLKWAALNKVYIVGWNTPFDVAWLIAHGLRDEVMACKWLDAMLVYKHVEQHPTFENYDPDVKAISYGLKAAIKRFMPEQPDYSKDVNFGAASDEEKAKLLDYNELDVDYTLQLFWMFWERLDAAQRRAVLIEAESIPLVADAVVEGIYGDDVAARDLNDALETEQNETFVRLKLTDEQVSRELLASPVQLQKLLYEDWKLPILRFTTGGSNASTDREALLELAAMDERAAMVSKYREATNNRTKFAEGMIESLIYNGDSRTRPQPRIYGTYTGRMTYSSKQGKGKSEVPTGVALHQWKRDPAFRKLITAPPGHTLVEFDFAGQEFRWMAVCSGDETMLELCQPGEDAHGYMGASIRGIDYRTLVERVKDGDKDAKNIRQLGKVANLSLQYRTSAVRLQSVAAVQYKIKLEDAEARAIHATYQQTYPRVPLFWQKQARLVKMQTFIANLLGRTVDLLQPYERGEAMDWSYTSTAINYPIQSMGAEQKFLALAVAKNYLPTYDARFYFELHDGLFFVVPDAKAEQFGHDMKRVLSNLPYRKAWGLELPTKFPVDGKLGADWGSLREFS